MCDGIGVLLVQRRLHWLGHVTKMGDNRLPKQLLFGELLTVRPSHGPRLRWRDVVLREIQRLELDALNWYDVAQDRSRWHDLCSTISSGGFLGVLLWSLALLSVAVGGLLVTLEISLDIANIALVNLLHSGKQSSAVGVAEFSGGCGRIFQHKGDLMRHQHYHSS